MQIAPRANRLQRVLLVAALLWIAALTQRGLPLAVDEVEFFRATKWVGEGRVPFRDFWEHHTPLQWMAFGPVASLFANGAGTSAIVAMRWAQMGLWVAMLVLLVRWIRRAGLDPWIALLLLLVSASFVRRAIEYRVDVLGNLAYLAGVSLIVQGAGRKRWAGFGALLSAAVLTNMRLVPLVVMTALLASLWRAEERRWGWNRRAPWMAAGVMPVAAAFIGWLLATGAWTAFLDGVVHYNVTSAQLLDVDTLFDALLLPLWTLDLGGIAYWIAGIAGTVLALRTIRQPGLPQFVAMLFLASLASIAMMEVQYDYHFQIAYLLMLPLVALAAATLQRPVWRALVPTLAVCALGISLLQTVPTFGDAIALSGGGDDLRRSADAAVGTRARREWIRSAPQACLPLLVPHHRRADDGGGGVAGAVRAA